MKAYIARIKSGVSVRTLIFWWIFRGLMLYAFFDGLFNSPDITDPLQVGANLLIMFLWEIFMAFPEKSTFRYVPASFQTVFIPGLFAASFGGKYMNLYYDSRFLDSFLHFMGTLICVYFGYELVCALLKKEKKNAPLSLILMASIGFAFIGSTLWEFFEFTFDQIACMGGGIGDAQHWSRGLAEGTPKMITLFDPIYDNASTVVLPSGETILTGDRWPIMDIMGDMFLNIIGAAAGYFAIMIYPYRHKGKYKFDFSFEDKKEEAISK